MRLVVAGIEVVHVVGGHHGQAQPLGDRQRPLARDPLVLQTVILDLQVEVLAPQHVHVPGGDLFRLGLVLLQEGVTELAVEAAREGEEPLRVLGEEFPVDARLVVEPLHVPGRDQLDQILVPGHVPGQERHVVRPLVLAILRRPFEPAGRRHVHLAADDGLDPLLAGQGVEVHRPEEVAVVGHGQGRHPVLLGLGHQLVELAGPIQERVLRVQMQVHEIRVRHC